MALPFVKWAGGKRKLAPRIMDLLGPMDIERDIYVEPFVGGGAVFFALKERYPMLRCRLSDINKEVINLYRVIRDIPGFLIDELSNTDRYRYDQKIYYAMRESEPTHAVEIAARTIYLNRCGFNGLYRTNGKGKFNVPFGDYDNPRILDSEGLMAASHALFGVAIEAAGFSEATYPPGSVSYMDPPYVPVSKTSSFTSYSGSFGADKQRELSAFAASLVHRGFRVVLSNSDTPLVRDLYSPGPFELVGLTAARNVSCKGEKRESAKELFIVGRPIQ